MLKAQVLPGSVFKRGRLEMRLLAACVPPAFYLRCSPQDNSAQGRQPNTEAWRLPAERREARVNNFCLPVINFQKQEQQN